MKREPVLMAGIIAGLVLLIVVSGISFDWLRLAADQTHMASTFVLPGMAFLAPVIAALWARFKVTPLKGPRTEAGEPAALLPLSLLTPEQQTYIQRHAVGLQ